MNIINDQMRSLSSDLLKFFKHSSCNILCISISFGCYCAYLVFLTIFLARKLTNTFTILTTLLTRRQVVRSLLSIMGNSKDQVYITRCVVYRLQNS